MACTDGLEKIRSVSSISISLPGWPTAARLKKAVRSETRRRLLHVVGDDHDREALLQLADQVLDGEGGDRVERRAGLVHQQHLRLDRDGAGDAQPLLLAAGQARAGLVQPVLDLVPEVGALERLLDDGVELALLADAVELQAGRHVVVDRHGGERVRAAGRPCRRCGGRSTGSTPEPYRFSSSSITLPSTRPPGVTSCIRFRVRRKVDLPQPDGPMKAVTERGLDGHRDVVDGLVGAVVGGQAADVDALGHGDHFISAVGLLMAASAT